MLRSEHWQPGGNSSNMTTHSANRRISTRPATAAIVLSLAIAAVAAAASFTSVQYDAVTDELVVTLVYRGTNPNHQFRLEWDECRQTHAHSNEIVGRVHDGQWDDRAEREFTKQVRFSLAQVRCRPANVTLFTEPNFRASVYLPARGNSPRALRGPRTDSH